MTTFTAESPSGRERRRGPARRWVAAALVAVAAAVVAVALVVADPFSTSGPPNTVGDNAGPTSLQPITRRDLLSQTQVSATLGYAGSYSVINQAQGTVTSLPSVGQIVSEGHVLYEVNGASVVLLYGTTPAYRSLSEGDSGADIEQLNYDLVALGEYSTGETAPTSDTFSAATEYGVEKLQAALGVTVNGTLALGQVVFEPTAVRVTSLSGTLGGSAQPGQAVLSATSTTRQVSIALDADQQTDVGVGDKVTITLPNNQSTPGVITAVGTVASSGQNGGSSTIEVVVTPTDPAATGTYDQAPVEVTITTDRVTNVLAVPVDTLLALSDGGYAVEVVDTDRSRHLVPVTLGLFDDAAGLVQVTGSGLAAGQQIVAPNL